MFAVEPVERTEGNLWHHLGDMHVGHGSGDAGMSHLFFEREQVKPLLQKMSGKTMAQRVKRNRFDDTSLFHSLMDKPQY